MSCPKSFNDQHLWDKKNKDGTPRNKWRCKLCGKIRSRQTNQHKFVRRDDTTGTTSLRG